MLGYCRADDRDTSDASCFNSNQMISGSGCHPPHPRYPAHTFKNKRIISKKESQNEIGAEETESKARPETMQTYLTKRIGTWEQKQVRCLCLGNQRPI
jgi:hypothetical protein